MREELKKVLVTAIIEQDCFMYSSYGEGSLCIDGHLEIPPIIDYVLANFKLEKIK